MPTVDPKSAAPAGEPGQADNGVSQADRPVNGGAGDLVVPSPEWFERPSVEVARTLLGAHLTHRTSDGQVTARLVEVEAYDGANDPGSHAFRGQTARNATMFGPGGHLYVYRHMGLHHCVNIVCGPPGSASAVLLRAGEIVDGVELARARRSVRGVTRSDRDLAQGPARLAVALGITHDENGADLIGGSYELRADEVAPPEIATGPRVGVSGEGGRADLYPWRFWISGDAHVSRYRAAAPSNRRR